MRNDICNADSIYLCGQRSVTNFSTHVKDCLEEPRRASVYGRCHHGDPVPPSNDGSAHELRRSDPQDFREFAVDSPEGLRYTRELGGVCRRGEYIRIQRRGGAADASALLNGIQQPTFVARPVCSDPALCRNTALPNRQEACTPYKNGRGGVPSSTRRCACSSLDFEQNTQRAQSPDVAAPMWHHSSGAPSDRRAGAMLRPPLMSRHILVEDAPTNGTERWCQLCS